jgi:hypothetical protein
MSSTRQMLSGLSLFLARYPGPFTFPLSFGSMSAQGRFAGGESLLLVLLNSFARVTGISREILAFE